MATANPRTESPKEKSWRIRGARLAVRKPGKTPATINAVPGTTDRPGPELRTRSGVQVLQGVGPYISEPQRRPRLRQRLPERARLRRVRHQQPLLLVLVQDQRRDSAHR